MSSSTTTSPVSFLLLQHSRMNTDDERQVLSLFLSHIYSSFFSRSFLPPLSCSVYPGHTTTFSLLCFHRPLPTLPRSPSAWLPPPFFLALFGCGSLTAVPAGLLVVSSSEAVPVEKFLKLSQEQHRIQHSGEYTNPKWFIPNTLKYYVLLHDMSQGDEQRWVVVTSQRARPMISALLLFNPLTSANPVCATPKIIRPIQ